MIQIRNVPDDLHRTLKVRAAQAGMTLSDYLLAQVEAVARRPTLCEIEQRVRALGPVAGLTESTVEALRAERESR